MRIETIRAYRVVQPFVGGAYNMSKGRSADAFDSLIVGMTSNTGLTGWGEMAPLGNFYSAAFPAGTRAGVPEIAPHLIGHDPRGLASIGRLMDTVFKGHPYIKSALDMACWDLLGKATGLPVCVLMGGRFGESIRLYRAISQQAPDEMAKKVAQYHEQGYTRFQLKVGGDPDTDIERIGAGPAMLRPTARLVADANTGWTQH